MASKVPATPKFIVTIQAPSGVRNTAYGERSVAPDGVEGYGLQMPFSQLPDTMQAEMGTHFREQTGFPDPPSLVNFWVPERDVVGVEATSWTYWQWEQTVLPPKSALL